MKRRAANKSAMPMPAPAPSPRPAWRTPVRNALVIAVAALFCSVPLFVTQHLLNPRISQSFALEVLALGAGLLVFPAALALRRRAPRPPAADVWVLALLGAMMLSSLLSAAPLASLRSGLVLYALVAIYFLVRLLPPSRLLMQSVVLLLLLSGAAVAVVGILQQHGAEFIAYQQAERRGKLVIASTLGNPNFVASFLAPMCFLSLALVIGGSRAAWRVAGFLPLPLILYCLLLTGGRAAWLGVVAGFVFLGAMAVVLLRRGRGVMLSRPLRAALAATALAMLAAAVGLLVAGPRFALLERLLSLGEIQQRFLMWHTCGMIFLDHPLFGLGTGRVFGEINDYFFHFFSVPANGIHHYAMQITAGGVPDHLHNEYLHLLAEHGLVGLSAFLIAVSSVLVAGWRFVTMSNPAPPGRRAALLLLAAIVCVLVDAFWGFPLHLPASGMLFWVVMALLVNMACQTDGSKAPASATLPAQGGGPAPRGVRIACLAAAVLLAALLVSGLLLSVLRAEGVRTRVHLRATPEVLRDPAQIQRLRTAYLRSPVSEPSPFLWVNTHIELHDEAAALEALQTIARYYNIGASGYQQLGYLLTRQERWEEAIDAFGRAWVLEPSKAAHLEYLAFSELQLDRADSAEAHLQRAARIDPLSPNAHYLLGRIAESRGERELALQRYRFALMSQQVARAATIFRNASLRERVKELEAGEQSQANP